MCCCLIWCMSSKQNELLKQGLLFHLEPRLCMWQRIIMLHYECKTWVTLTLMRCVVEKILHYWICVFNITLEYGPNEPGCEDLKCFYCQCPLSLWGRPAVWCSTFFFLQVGALTMWSRSHHPQIPCHCLLCWSTGLSSLASFLSRVSLIHTNMFNTCCHKSDACAVGKLLVNMLHITKLRTLIRLTVCPMMSYCSSALPSCAQAIRELPLLPLTSLTRFADNTHTFLFFLLPSVFFSLCVLSPCLSLSFSFSILYLCLFPSLCVCA